MGSKCACLTQALKDEHSLRFAQNSSAVNSSLEEIDLADLIQLQGVLRGYMDRRKAKNLYNTYRNQRAKIYKKVPNPELGSALVVSNLDKVPDFTSKNVQNAIKKLGAYRYKQPGDKVERVSRGPIELSNKAVYIGEWNQRSERDGYGMQIWPDSTLYEGYWKADTVLRGRFIYENGDAYDGLFENNKAEGRGNYYHYEGAAYVGDWVADKRQGVGHETTAEGVSYRGEFLADKKHGKGLMVFTDGCEYDGEFCEDLITGFGSFLWPDGREYQGEWVRGKMQGKGTFCWQDGRKYEGDYWEDMKHGNGKFTAADGTVYDGGWVKGKKHGIGVQIQSNGIRRKGEWDNGRRVKWLEH
jgi:hypothetical protein